MILLDTNVVSEMMGPSPDPGVRGWLNNQAAESIYLSSVSLDELLFGIACLPSGRRKDALASALNDLQALFGPRILPFDAEAARTYAVLRSRARAAGRAVSSADGYIAAIAAVQNLTVATRDTGPFAAVGLTVINPWDVRDR
jgi:predicted nucleic acid-binding protein